MLGLTHPVSVPGQVLGALGSMLGLTRPVSVPGQVLSAIGSMLGLTHPVLVHCDRVKNTLDRRTQTTVFQLRTGHCGLRKHRKRLGLADSAHFECGSEEQTPERILQTCPHLGTVRQQFWPEDTEVGTKLWGQVSCQTTADS